MFPEASLKCHHQGKEASVPQIPRRRWAALSPDSRWQSLPKVRGGIMCLPKGRDYGAQKNEIPFSFCSPFSGLLMLCIILWFNAYLVITFSFSSTFMEWFSGVGEDFICNYISLTLTENSPQCTYTRAHAAGCKLLALPQQELPSQGCFGKDQGREGAQPITINKNLWGRAGKSTLKKKISQ